MKKWLLIALPVGLVAFLLHPTVFPPSMHGPAPTPSQLPFFILLTIIESLSLGLGIAFLALGYPLIKKSLLKSRNLVTAVYVSIAWYLTNWWFHDGLHMANGMDLQGLLYIEYAFHVTLIVGGAILAYAFLLLLTAPKKA
jgi:hypothetical protein